ncbi:hypothetical protein KW783_03075 [Candidatus Parcubacteria bacterium]|nr:hypothetical protein [Candidatus Parcubacteria bacterium]
MSKDDKTQQLANADLFDDFTSRAQRVISLATQEAQSFNHERIASGHLLIGLIKEGTGIAATVLKEMNIDLHKVRLEMEKLAPSPAGMANVRVLPHSTHLETAIARARVWVKALGHNRVGTEHLLLGIVDDGNSGATQALMSLRVTPEEVRDKLLHFLVDLSDVEVRHLRTMIIPRHDVFEVTSNSDWSFISCKSDAAGILGDWRLKKENL